MSVTARRYWGTIQGSIQVKLKVWANISIRLHLQLIHTKSPSNNFKCRWEFFCEGLFFYTGRLPGGLFRICHSQHRAASCAKSAVRSNLCFTQELCIYLMHRKTRNMKSLQSNASILFAIWIQNFLLLSITFASRHKRLVSQYFSSIFAGRSIPVDVTGSHIIFASTIYMPRLQRWTVHWYCCKCITSCVEMLFWWHFQFLEETWEKLWILKASTWCSASCADV